MKTSFCIIPLLLLLLSLPSCRSCPTYYCVEGADEFVTDSYRIREGKASILEMEGKCINPLPDDAMEEYIDTVCDDDILNIAIYHPTRKDLMISVQTINETIGFRVVDGMLDIPDLEPIMVGGLTLEEAKNALQEKFREQIKDVELFVSYKDRLSRKVELMGLVSTACIPVDGKMRLYDALAIAHVPPNANLFKSYFLRDGCPIAIDFYRLIHEGDMCHNIVLKGGDKVYIAPPCDARIMVMGEVLRPMPLDLHYGFISLREALVAAGGIPFTGDKRNIQVIRGNMLKPKIYVLAWEHVVNLPNDSLLLMPGDTVYVSAKPITEWNRFISQLLPSLSGAQTGWSTYSMIIP